MKHYALFSDAKNPSTEGSTCPLFYFSRHFGTWIGKPRGADIPDETDWSAAKLEMEALNRRSRAISRVHWRNTYKIPAEEKHEAEMRITGLIIDVCGRTDNLFLEWNNFIIAQKSYRKAGVVASKPNRTNNR